MYTQDEIQKITKKLIKRTDSANPFRIAENLNVNVIEYELGSILGYYKYYKRNKYIIINQNLDEVMKLIVCSHELGHAVLHARVNTPYLTKFTLFSESKIERDANIFAMYILQHLGKWNYYVFINILKLPETIIEFNREVLP
jgi:Zn-dependent peptidase ImmA (M78 family)